LVVLLLAVAWGLAGLLAVASSSGSASVSSYVRGQVRVWVIVYRAHDGKRRRAYLDLPRWYGPKLNPRLPLVISPHGRQARAQANSALWGNLPARGSFAVVNPDGEGRVLGNESWGDPGQIADLARMPVLLKQALPWLRLNRRRVYAVGGSMGGQEALLLLGRYPRLLAGVAAFDAPTDLAERYRDLRLLRHGLYLRRLMLREVGATPAAAPRLYAARSPLQFATQIASSHVPVELWWSRRDRVVVDQAKQSGRLYRLLMKLNPQAPVRQIVGNWGHMAEMSWRTDLAGAVRWLGLLPRSASATVSAVHGLLCCAARHSPTIHPATIRSPARLPTTGRSSRSIGSTRYVATSATRVHSAQNSWAKTGRAASARSHSTTASASPHQTEHPSPSGLRHRPRQTAATSLPSLPTTDAASSTSRSNQPSSLASPSPPLLSGL
jgi:pimeloyl-ACP methyl ester carboxylesterase